jgi:hypothetical protein
LSDITDVVKGFCNDEENGYNPVGIQRFLSCHGSALITNILTGERNL